MRDEVAKLRKVLADRETTEDTARPHSGGACRAQTPPAEARQLKVAIKSLRTENRRLGKELARWRKAVGELHKKVDGEKERAKTIRESAKKLSRENLRLHRELRYLKDVETWAQSLSDEVYRLRHALKLSRGREEKLKARLAELRAAGATLSKLPFDEAAQLRTVLKRSRRQKATIKSLSPGFLFSRPEDFHGPTELLRTCGVASLIESACGLKTDKHGLHVRHCKYVMN